MQLLVGSLTFHATGSNYLLVYGILVTIIVEQ